MAISDNPEGWTFDTLHNSIISLIEANDRRYAQQFTSSQEAVLSALNAAQTAVNAALSAAEKAVTKAEIASEKRFDNVNEFRATLADQQRTLMPRTEVELIIQSLRDIASTNAKNIASLSGAKSGMKDGWGYIVGIVGILAALFSFITAYVK